jgi:type I restriction enzyme R subunit
MASQLSNTVFYTVLRDGFLVNPSVVDARTEITTQLLNDEGYTVQMTDEDGEEISTTFSQRDFEKKLFLKIQTVFL